jgi:hypothetical protein
MESKFGVVKAAPKDYKPERAVILKAKSPKLPTMFSLLKKAINESKR